MRKSVIYGYRSEVGINGKVKNGYERNSIQTLERVYKHYYYNNTSEENEMGFIMEHVPREDWDLYNSFELIEKSINIGQKIQANEHSMWKVDRERNIYFVMTGVIGREEIYYYTLVLNGKKVNIIAGFERRFENGMQRGYTVDSIIADKRLESREREYLEVIKEALLLGRKNGLDFIEFAKPRYREEIN